MAPDDRAGGQALGLGGQDVILPQDFEHAGPHVAGHARQAADGIDQDRQCQMLRQIKHLVHRAETVEIHGRQAGNRQPLQMDTEEQHQQQCQPERGHGKTEVDEDRHAPIQKGILAAGREDADGDGDDERQDQGDDVHAHGQGQALHDLVQHGPSVR